MAKYINDDVMDASLSDLAESAWKIYVCTTETISTYADVSSADLTTGASMTSTNFTIGNGDASGRKVAISQFSSLNISTSGTAGQIAIVSSASELLLLTNVTTQALTSGNTVTIPTFDYEIADPT